VCSVGTNVQQRAVGPIQLLRQSYDPPCCIRVSFSATASRMKWLSEILSSFAAFVARSRSESGHHNRKSSLRRKMKLMVPTVSGPGDSRNRGSLLASWSRNLILSNGTFVPAISAELPLAERFRQVASSRMPDHDPFGRANIHL
jgi:hypothetical protein